MDEGRILTEVEMDSAPKVQTTIPEENMTDSRKIKISSTTIIMRGLVVLCVAGYFGYRYLSMKIGVGFPIGTMAAMSTLLIVLPEYFGQPEDYKLLPLAKGNWSFISDPSTAAFTGWAMLILALILSYAFPVSLVAGH